MVTPDQDTDVRVTVTGAGTGEPVSGSGQLHYSIDGGAYQVVDMSESGPSEYIATLPAISCGSHIDYYFSASEDSVGVIYDHQESPYRSYPNNIDATVFADDFESDLGWTFSGGQWERGTPTGGGGSSGPPDPSSAHSGTNELGYNLDGDYSNGLPEIYATSPAIDCSDLAQAELRFWRWLGVEPPSWDKASVSISSDGVTWTTVWQNPARVSDSVWVEQVLDISAYADRQETVYLRFTMGPTDGSGVCCGWNIDDVTVSGIGCRGAYVCGDANADQIANVTDAVYLITYIFNGGPEPVPYESGDANCDGIANITDAVYLIMYIFSDGAPPCDTDNSGEPDC